MNKKHFLYLVVAMASVGVLFNYDYVNCDDINSSLDMENEKLDKKIYEYSKYNNEQSDYVNSFKSEYDSAVNKIKALETKKSNCNCK